MTTEAATPETPEKKKRSPKVMIAPEKWAEVERAWSQGKFASIKALAEHFDLPEDKVKERMLRQGIKKGQSIEDYNRAVQAELEKKAAEDARLLAERITETKEEHYRMAHAVAKMTYNEVLKCHQGKIPFSGAKGNLDSLQSAMKVLKLAREERFAVLGIGEGTDDDGESTPELVINELSSEQIEELRNRAPVVEEEEDEIVELKDSDFEDDKPEDEDEAE